MAACGCSPLSVGVILFGPASYRTQLTGGQVFHTDDGPYFAIEAGTVIQVDFVPHQLDSSDTDDSSCSTDDDASGDDDLQRAADHPSTADETSPGVLSTLGSHHYWGIPSGSAGADAANPHVGGADALSYDGARFAALLPSVTEARVIKYSLCQTSNQCLPPGPGHYLRHAGPLPGVCPRHSYLPSAPELTPGAVAVNRAEQPMLTLLEESALSSGRPFFLASTLLATLEEHL